MIISNPNKKIDKFLEHITTVENVDLPVIMKYFKSVNYTYNGDNLLHLFIKNKNTKDLSVRTILYIIKLLISNGVEPNKKNNEGKTFLHLLIDENYDSCILENLMSSSAYIDKTCRNKICLNLTDNDGKNIFHYLAEKGGSEYLSLIHYYAYSDKMKTLINTPDKNNITVIEILRKKQEESLKKDNLDFGSHKSWFLTRSAILMNFELMNFDEFVERLSNSKNLGEELKLYHSREITELIYKIMKFNDEEKALKLTKEILLLIKDENWYCAVSTVFKHRSIDYFYKIMDFCIEKGHKPNKNTATDILCDAILSNVSTDNLANIYIYLTKKGCTIEKVSSFTSSFLSSSTARTRGRIQWTEISINDYIEGLNFSNKLLNLLQENNIQIDNHAIYNIKFIETIFELYNENDDFSNLDELATVLANKISDELNNNLNRNNQITTKEIAYIFKNMIVESYNNKINKILVKKNLE